MIATVIRRLLCVVLTHDDRLVMRGTLIGRWCARCGDELE